MTKAAAITVRTAFVYRSDMIEPPKIKKPFVPKFQYVYNIKVAHYRNFKMRHYVLQA